MTPGPLECSTSSHQPSSSPSSVYRAAPSSCWRNVRGAGGGASALGGGRMDVQPANHARPAPAAHAAMDLMTRNGDTSSAGSADRVLGGGVRYRMISPHWCIGHYLPTAQLRRRWHDEWLGITEWENRCPRARSPEGSGKPVTCFRSCVPRLLLRLSPHSGRGHRLRLAQAQFVVFLVQRVAVDSQIIGGLELDAFAPLQGFLDQGALNARDDLLPDAPV